MYLHPVDLSNLAKIQRDVAFAYYDALKRPIVTCFNTIQIDIA